MSVEDYLEPIFEDFEVCNESDILRFEKMNSVSLPDDYKYFLRKYGRCMFSGEAYIEDTNLEVFTMFGINSTAGNIEYELKIHPDYVKNGYVPIGDDSFNNRYVLNITNGHVLYLDYAQSGCNIIVVSESFTGFLQKIRVVIDE